MDNVDISHQKSNAIKQIARIIIWKWLRFKINGKVKIR